MSASSSVVTIREAAVRWVRTFSAVPASLISRAYQKAYGYEAFELLASGDRCSDCCDDETESVKVEGTSPKDDSLVIDHCLKCGCTCEVYWSGSRLLAGGVEHSLDGSQRGGDVVQGER